MDWEKTNRIGYQVEHALALLTIGVAAVVLMLWLVQLEWRLLPERARVGVTCSEYAAAQARTFGTEEAFARSGDSVGSLCNDWPARQDHSGDSVYPRGLGTPHG